MALLKLGPVFFSILTIMASIGQVIAQENEINSFDLAGYRVSDMSTFTALEVVKSESSEEKNVKKIRNEEVDGFLNRVYTYSTEPFSLDNLYEIVYLSTNTYALHALDERVAREINGNSTFNNDNTVTFGLPRGEGLGDGALFLLTSATLGSYGFAADDDKWIDAFSTLATGCLVLSAEVQILKLSGRDRPKRTSGVSFPGGGAASAACTAAVTHRFFGAKVGTGMYVLAAGVGLGRMGEHEHWLTDTVFGWGFGALMGWQYAGYSKYALYKDAYKEKGMVYKYPMFVEVQPAHNTIHSKKIVFGGNAEYNRDLGEYGITVAVVTRKGRMENLSKFTSYPSKDEFRLITKVNFSDEGIYWPQVAGLLEVENHILSGSGRIEGFANAGLAISKKIPSLGMVANLNLGRQYGSKESYDGILWGISARKSITGATSMIAEIKENPELSKIKGSLGFMTRISKDGDFYGKIGTGGNGKLLAQVGAQWRFDSKF